MLTKKRDLRASLLAYLGTEYHCIHIEIRCTSLNIEMYFMDTQNSSIYYTAYYQLIKPTKSCLKL